MAGSELVLVASGAVSSPVWWRGRPFVDGSEVLLSELNIGFLISKIMF